MPSAVSPKSGVAVGLQALWFAKTPANASDRRSTAGDGCATKPGRLEGFGGAEAADDGDGIALVGVDFGIEMAHFFGGDFIG
jgi:hypothetical protein